MAETKKVALLVSFSPMTRIVQEIPADQTLDEWLANPFNLGQVSSTAREKMLKDLGDYLNKDNIEVAPDEECSATEDEPLDV